MNKRSRQNDEQLQHDMQGGNIAAFVPRRRTPPKPEPANGPETGFHSDDDPGPSAA